MPASKRSAPSLFLSLILWGTFLLTFPSLITAANLTPNRCPVNSTCTIGEFLYGDDYTPVLGAPCTLTTRDPSGNLFLNNVALTGNADGWYEYTLNTNATIGLYRTQLCCTVDSQLQCIDKSFTVTEEQTPLTAADVESAVLDAATANHNTAGTIGEAIQQQAAGTLTAAEVWSHPTRSLSTFGTLVADIWGNSNRSLSTFGNLITDLWNNSSRTLTSETAVSTTTTNTNTTVNNISTQVTAIAAQLQDQRIVLEEIAHAPIIETTIEDSSLISLETKLEQTTTATNRTAQLTAKLITQVNQLQSAWSNSPSSQLADQLQALTKLIGTQKDSPDQDTLNASLNYLSSAWDNQLTQDLSQLASTLTAQTHDLFSKLSFYGKSRLTTENLTPLLTAAHSLSQLVGKEQDDQNTPTLYGHLRFLNYLSTQLSTNENALNQLLSDWTKLSLPQRQSRLSQIRTQLLSLSRLPQTQVLGASVNTQPEITQKNETLYLLALAQSNRRFLAQSPNQPVQNIWLEEGSVIFKAMISNPSRVISQTVPLKFYLPREVSQEDIIKMDSQLTAHYDTDKEAVYISGEFVLAPSQTRTFAIEVTDLWTIDPIQIESLRSQANQLLEPLKNTNYFGQGTTLKSDIDVSLDNILSKQATALTPDARIRAYREAQIELNGVNQKIESLKTLISAAGSTGSIFGFVGGVQAVAVWGLIIILASGFIFLALYMRAINARSTPLPFYHGPEPTLPPTPTAPQPRHPRRPKSTSLRLAQLFFLTMAAGSISSLFLGTALAFQRPTPKIAALTKKSTLSNASKTPADSSPDTLAPSPKLPQDDKLTTALQPQSQNVLGKKTTQSRYAVLIASPGSPTLVYKTPDPLSPILHQLDKNQTVFITNAQDDYLQIDFLVQDQLTTGWVLQTSISDNPHLN